MSKKITVAVWGTGNVGAACCKEILKGDRYDLVGALVHNEEKDGKDIGAFLDLGGTGIVATRDREALYALRPDCILYAAKDHGDFRTDPDIAEILQRGINVITCLPYHYLPRRPEVEATLKTAAEQGGATLFATGINPGSMFERLAMNALGLSNDVKSIELNEYIKIGTEPSHTLNAWGFGLSYEESRSKEQVRLIAEQYFGMPLFQVADLLGTPIDRLEHRGEWRIAEQDVRTPTMVVEKGQVAFISHRWEARTGTGLQLVSQCSWYLSDEQKPSEVSCEDFYAVMVEGTPSIRMNVELKASVRDDLRMYANDPIIPAYYATAVPMIHAIERVVNARPGVMLVEPPSNPYWRPVAA